MGDRPFVEAHPVLVLATLRAWERDPSVHVRRLVSEGSRPRLPWGMQLRSLVADPSPTLPLLAALQDDPSEYVRRSVANHLNDIAKDHPQVVAAWLEAHLPSASPERTALLRRASRTLVKRGDAALLRLWGIGEPFRGNVRFAASPRRAVVGDELRLEACLISTLARPQPLVVDYAVHFVASRGATSRKVYKGWSLTLDGCDSRVLTKRHSLRPITTRVYRSGLHRVDLLVNGRVVSDTAFSLRA